MIVYCLGEFSLNAASILHSFNKNHNHRTLLICRGDCLNIYADYKLSGITRALCMHLCNKAHTAIQADLHGKTALLFDGQTEQRWSGCVMLMFHSKIQRGSTVFLHHWLPAWPILPAAVDAVVTREASKNKHCRSFPGRHVFPCLGRFRKAAALRLLWTCTLTLMAAFYCVRFAASASASGVFWGFVKDRNLIDATF